MIQKENHSIPGSGWLHRFGTLYVSVMILIFSGNHIKINLLMRNTMLAAQAWCLPLTFI